MSPARNTGMTEKAEVKSLQGRQLARKRYGCNVAATQICFDTRRGQVFGDTTVYTLEPDIS